jgi:hypothetical protein
VADADYMSTWEFAELPADVHHAVWAAHRDGRIDAIPYTQGQPGGVLRYRADRVREIAAGLAAAR